MFGCGLGRPWDLYSRHKRLDFTFKIDDLHNYILSFCLKLLWVLNGFGNRVNVRVCTNIF